MGDQPKILGNEIRRFELQTTIRLRESSKSPSKCLDSAAYKNYKVTNKGSKKKLSHKLNLRLIMNYLASWERKIEKTLLINLLTHGKENKRLELYQMHII